MTILSMRKDVQGQNTFTLEPSDNIFNTTLLAGVAQTFTVPVSALYWVAVFSFDPGSTVFFAHNTTAALPGSSVTASTSELNPVSWLVKSGDTISAITNDTSDYVEIKFYVSE